MPRICRLVLIATKARFHSCSLGKQIPARLEFNRPACNISPVVDVLDNHVCQFVTHRFNILWAERGSFLVSEQDLEAVGRDAPDAVFVFFEVGFDYLLNPRSQRFVSTGPKAFGSSLDWMSVGAGEFRWRQAAQTRASIRSIPNDTNMIVRMTGAHIRDGSQRAA